jgi:hypothetical protein
MVRLITRKGGKRLAPWRQARGRWHAPGLGKQDLSRLNMNSADNFERHWAGPGSEPQAGLTSGAEPLTRSSPWPQKLGSSDSELLLRAFRVSSSESSSPLGLGSGFEPSDLDRPGRLPHQQGLCEARLSGWAAKTSHPTGSCPSPSGQVLRDLSDQEF